MGEGVPETFDQINNVDVDAGGVVDGVIVGDPEAVRGDTRTVVPMLDNAR